MISRFRILRDENNGIVYADFRKALELSKWKLVSNRSAHRLSNPFIGVNFDAPLWTPHWTKTMVAYPKADEPFEKVLETTDELGRKYLLETADYKNERNMALAFDDFRMEQSGDKTVIVPLGKISVVNGFPQKCGSSDEFGSDEGSGLPVVNGRQKLRFWRNHEASILPAVRTVYGSKMPAVWLRYGISREFAVMVEEPIPESSS